MNRPIREPIYKAYNPLTHRYDTFDDPDEVELPVGAIVIKLFWCESADRYVTIPGASLFRVSPSKDLAPER